MAQVSLIQPQIGLPDTTEDPKIQNAFTAIVAAINGGLDATNISAALAQSAAVNQSGQTVKGLSVIATSESRSNVAFGLMPTPDQVTGIVLPANGLIQVWYQATWQESVANAAQAEIMLNNVPIQVTENNGSILFGAASVASSAGANHKTPLSSYALGLISPPATGTDSVADVTTGQVIGNQAQSTGAGGGGPCSIFAAAGTYTVSVQFKASSGSVTVNSRRLMVQALSFA